MKRIFAMLFSVVSLLTMFCTNAFAQSLNNPITGDSGATLWIILAAAALLVMLLFMILKNKKTNDD